MPTFLIPLKSTPHIISTSLFQSLPPLEATNIKTSTTTVKTHTIIEMLIPIEFAPPLNPHHHKTHPTTIKTLTKTPLELIVQNNTKAPRPEQSLEPPDGQIVRNLLHPLQVVLEAIVAPP